MTFTVTQTRSNYGANVLAAVAKYVPGATKKVVHCGFEAAKLPLKGAKELAAEFTTNVSTPVGDMLMDWTQTASEKGTEKATRWTISAADYVAHKISGR
ncbi:MAG: hypothetical protein J6Y53_02220 [Alphaproteobacteria bacterium]|nr:hypothetical protein [Alphaproteobacteria bacterium]